MAYAYSRKNSQPQEIRLVVFAMVLPVFLCLAAAAYLVHAAWQRMVSSERNELETQAVLMAHLLTCHECAAIDDSRILSCVAFEIRDRDGGVFFVSGNWPDSPAMSGECELSGPFEGKTLAVVRADGGAAFRLRETRMFASAAVGTAFPVLLFLVYGLMHIRTIRRERRYARERAVFLDNVSHELKTPISGIRLNAELLADGRISDEGQRRDAMEAMIVETDRIGRLVDELLDFSRLERGMRKLSLVPLELSAYVLDPVEVQRTAGVSRGLAKVKVVGPCACVVADVDALRQIGTILISNALKYAGGEIEIEAEGCCLRCMDRGPGVPRGDEERIFDRFYRCDDSLTAKASGSGLGLAIARTLAREMGGELEYAHRPGGGSVFTLRLREAER